MGHPGVVNRCFTVFSGFLVNIQLKKMSFSVVLSAAVHISIIAYLDFKVGRKNEGHLKTGFRCLCLLLFINIKPKNCTKKIIFSLLKHMLRILNGCLALEQAQITRKRNLTLLPQKSTHVSHSRTFILTSSSMNSYNAQVCLVTIHFLLDR